MKLILMRHFYSKRLSFLMLSIIIGALLVLYLSWVSSPKIGEIRFIPSWMASWVDTYEFFTIRTAIPFIILGMLSGWYLNYLKREVLSWFFVWLMLSLLVILAELGQYFRPMRSFDWKDIAWGSIGAALGLSLLYAGSLFWGYFLKLKKI
tara:strand:- start:957 stop:1406 length:450 start_codon:yes stop_codon:yes gene_type:complete